MSKNNKATTFTSAALAIAFSATAMAAESPKGSTGASISAGDKVHCYGVHSCKGNSDCKTAEHQCKGQNACAGHGFKGISATECLEKGGTISDLKS